MRAALLLLLLLLLLLATCCCCCFVLRAMGYMTEQRTPTTKVTLITFAKII